MKAKQDIYGLTGNLDNTKIIGTTDVHYGKYVYCQQYINNIPVFATNFIVQINNDNVVTCALNEFRNISKYKEIENKPFISNSEALEIVYNHLNIKSDKDIIGEPKTELTYFESIDNGLELTWKINVVSINPHGDWQAFVNANNKNIIHLENIMQNANGTGKIFNPNPLVSTNTSYGGSYIHNNNANSTF